MDPLSAVASITAVVTITAQSTKIIYGIILHHRDSPRQAERLTASLDELQRVLQQIKQLNRNGDLDTPGHEGLAAAAEDCSHDLQSMEKRANRYRPSATENGIQKAFRHIKISFRAEDMDQMRSIVQYHLQALNVQLSVAGLADLQRIDHSIQGEFTDLRSHIQWLSQNVRAIDLHSKSKGAEASSTLQQTLTSVTELQSRVEEYFNDDEVKDAVRRKESAKAQENSIQVMDTVSGLTKRVDNLNEMSVEQYSTLKDMLSQLLSQADPKNSLEDPQLDLAESELGSTSGILTPNSSSSVTNGDGNGPLEQSIGRLNRLNSKIGKTLYSQEAQGIIDDLEEIIKAATTQTVVMPPQDIQAKRKRENWPTGYVVSEEKDLQTRQDLRRVRGLLAASQAISLTQAEPTEYAVAQRKPFKIDNRSQSFITASGTITLFSSAKQRDTEHQDLSNALTSDEKTIVEEYTDTFTFMPSNPTAQQKFFATFIQRITATGSMASNPSLSFSSIIPRHSEVFTFVQNGQLDALKRQLQNGEASLTDCDPQGRSLLSYAHYYCQPEVCKYLIEKGADVNAREPALPEHSPTGYMRPVLMQISMRSRMTDSTVGGCRKVLLDAGADPTIEDFGAGTTRHTSFQTMFKEAVNVATLKAVLEIGGIFVDLEERFQDGRTPLLSAASGGRDGIEPDVISILLQHGSNPQARDLKGNTCLHIAVRYNNSYWYLPRLTRALVQMINAGADVHAENGAGVTVSETAIRANVWEAWSEALSICGIDAVNVRDGTFTRIQADFDAKVGLRRRRGW